MKITSVVYLLHSSKRWRTAQSTAVETSVHGNVVIEIGLCGYGDVVMWLWS